MDFQQYWNAHQERNPKVKQAVVDGTEETTTVTVRVSSLKALLNEAFTRGQENVRGSRRADMGEVFKDLFGGGGK